MPQYRKKPVVIVAHRFYASDETCSIVDWIISSGGTARWHDDNTIAIDTLEGTMKASDGDYIIRGVQGEFYPCKADIFEATYEIVSY